MKTSGSSRTQWWHKGVMRLTLSNKASGFLHCGLVLSVLLLLPFGLGDAQATEPVWMLRSATGPSPRCGHVMAHDSARGVTVLFGGYDGAFDGETWQWNGSTWTQQTVAGPSPRSQPGMTYDSARSVTVLFGGYYNDGVNAHYYQDTWEWDGNIWTQKASTGPSPRNHPAMAYDSARGVTILFGGVSDIGSVQLYGDTWEWDGIAWTQRTNTGPSSRAGARMAYDSARGMTVLFGGGYGGSYNGDTWEWNGSMWTLRASTGPSPRYSHYMVYDIARGLTVLFGGRETVGYDGETWEWNGNTWVLRMSTGPSPRVEHTMAYDSARGVTVLFGGCDGSGGLGDTWEYGIPDCNSNGIPDPDDIAAGTSQDCNANDVPDECDITGGTSQDCNTNGIPDECDLADGTSLDCNNNGVPDECEPDCNANAIPDECDLSTGGSLDCNTNQVPDECETDCNCNGVPDACDITEGACFDNPALWATFDAGANGVGSDPDGFFGAVFDGRYVYFAPHHNGTEYHGEVLRYDTISSFSAVSSWSTFDPGANGVGVDPDGFFGAIFDGRYVYFVPNHNGADVHGEVLRYDITGNFPAASSWTTFDPGANGIGSDPDGFEGAVFDGRYVYFAPHHNGTEYHGEVLRYDTISSFSAVSSWTTFDPGANGVGVDPDGFHGAVFDGQYVYFVPWNNGTEPHGEVLRYDTTGNFSTTSSWTTFDPGANGIGSDPDGFEGAVFDGQYVYFVPWNNGTEPHGEVLRYDTTGNFSTTSSWTTFDPGANGIGSDPDGFFGAVFDGRYVYFVPYDNGTEYHGEVLRYDTTGGFSTTSSWTTFDPGANGVGSDPDGFHRAVFDGRYVYFVPYYNGTNYHGEVLRYDTVPGRSPDCNTNGIPDECDIADEPILDCNANGVPDDCDLIRRTVLAAADFESGLPSDWTATGLWHVTGACVRAGACDPPNWAYFGVDGACDFDTGSAEAGDLTSPPIFIPPNAISATLTYCSAYGGDRGIPPDGPDAAWVEINGQLNQAVSNPPTPINVWESQPRSIDLTEYIGQTITVAWRFNSQDFEGNDRLGWQVDDITVIADIDHDCDGNAVPDECDPDCNANGTADACDITDGTSPDCNTNGIPDECDIGMGGSSLDCNANNIPDECDAAPLPILLSARSIAAHKLGGGQTADFHIELDIGGNPVTRTSESRNSGIRRLEFQFDRDVESAQLTIVGPTGLCAGGCPLEIDAGIHGPDSLAHTDLGAPLANQNVYTLRVSASTGLGCDAAYDVCSAALVGDFNSDGRVNVSDKGELLGFVFQPITQTTARYDLQVDGADSGRVDVGDVGAWTGFFGASTAGAMCP